MRPLIKTLTIASRALSNNVAMCTLNAIVISSVMMSSSMAATIATTYDNSCAACHDSGALGALKKGDSAAWQQLKQKKGMPALVKSVKVGMIQMPAGGLCDNCSDDDYRELINFMSK